PRNAVGPAAFRRRRDHHAQTRGDRGASRALFRELKAVIEHQVSRGAVAAGEPERHRERRLVAHRLDRPLLRERSVPDAVSRTRHHEDVLEDSSLLVERLFDEERVVRDAELRLGLRLGESHGCESRNENGDGEQATHYFPPAATKAALPLCGFTNVALLWRHGGKLRRGLAAGAVHERFDAI